MSGKNEVFYECGPDDDFEEIENEEDIHPKANVSFIPDDTQGRVLQQAFSVCPKSDNETLKERYNRLRSELVLLHERIELENQKSSSLKQQHVEDIHTYLSALKSGSSDKTKVGLENENAKRLAALNNRISDLEWTLRLNNDQQPSSSVLPLLKTLEDLKIRVSIITPDLLTRVNKRIQDITADAKLSKAEIGNDPMSLAARDDKSGVLEMYDLIKRWDTNCKELPNVVAHLAASRQLHEDAERVCRKYAQFMALKADIEKALHFQQKFDELNNKQNTERIESIRQKISAIQEGNQ